VPTYVYKCPECGKEKEVVRPAADQTIEVCACGVDMKKVPQTFGFNWKEGKPT
jgi:putative FmdB family regulatory protein